MVRSENSLFKKKLREFSKVTENSTYCGCIPLSSNRSIIKSIAISSIHYWCQFSQTLILNIRYEK